MSGYKITWVAVGPEQNCVNTPTPLARLVNQPLCPYVQACSSIKASHDRWCPPHLTSAPSHISESLSVVWRGSANHRLKATSGSTWPGLSQGRDVGGQRVCVWMYRWLPEMTGIPRGHIFQSTLFQSTGCVWNPVSLDPSCSTQMANANGGATCFSSVRTAAIYKTSLMSSAVIGQCLPFRDKQYSDSFTVWQKHCYWKGLGKSAGNFPLWLNINPISSFWRTLCCE